MARNWRLYADLEPPTQNHKKRGLIDTKVTLKRVMTVTIFVIFTWTILVVFPPKFVALITLLCGLTNNNLIKVDKIFRKKSQIMMTKHFSRLFLALLFKVSNLLSFSFWFGYYCYGKSAFCIIFVCRKFMFHLIYFGDNSSPTITYSTMIIIWNFFE